MASGVLAVFSARSGRRPPRARTRPLARAEARPVLGRPGVHRSAISCRRKVEPIVESPVRFRFPDRADEIFKLGSEIGGQRAPVLRGPTDLRAHRWRLGLLLYSSPSGGCPELAQLIDEQESSEIYGSTAISKFISIIGKSRPPASEHFLATTDPGESGEGRGGMGESRGRREARRRHAGGTPHAAANDAKADLARGSCEGEMAAACARLIVRDQSRNPGPAAALCG